MAEETIAAKKTEYSLPEDVRLSLICQTRFGRRAILIEKQRKAFIARYGDPFGQVEPPVKKH